MNRTEGFYNVSIHPRSLKISWEPYDRLRITRRGYNTREIPKNNKPAGLISIKAQKRINAAIDWMLAQSKQKKYYSKKHGKHFYFRINFITLDLPSPQVHTDNEIKSRCLNNLLVQLRNKWGVKYYIWRAESQANGNIHFHISCDKFIPWWELRHTWNKIVNNLGYVDAYTAKYSGISFEKYLEYNPPNKKFSVADRKRGYDAGCKCDWTDPNSVDVHKVKRIRNLGAYLSKEIAKNSKGTLYTPVTFSKGKFLPCFNPSLIENKPDKSHKMYRVIQGNLWNLSESLSKIKAACLVVAGKAQEELELIYKYFKSNVFDGDYFRVFNVPVKNWAYIVKGVLWDAWQNNLSMIQYGYVQNKISFI